MARVSYAYATVSAAAIADFAIERFALGEIASCHLVRRGLNDTYALSSAGRAFVLRLSRHGRRRRSDVEHEALLLAHLASRSVPVAACRRGRDGRYAQELASIEGPRLALLLDAVAGRPPEPTEADARAQGETLARIHAGAADFAAGEERFGLDLGHLLDRPLARLHPLLADRPDDQAYLDALGRQLRARVAERAPGLSRGWCHGDCHGANARIAPDGTAIFFDFDDGGDGWIAYDLAVFPWSARAFNPGSLALWRPFLDGYAARRPIAPADLDAVPLFIPIRHIWLVGEWAAGADDWGAEWIGHSLERQIAQLKSWMADLFPDQLSLGFPP